jgi:hypothetical protein
MGATTTKYEGRLRHNVFSQFCLETKLKNVAEYPTRKTARACARAYVVAENYMNDFGEILPLMEDG